MKSFYCKCWKTTLYLDTVGSGAIIAVSALLLLAAPVAASTQLAKAEAKAGIVAMVCPEKRVIAIAMNTIPWPSHRPERVVKTIREQC